MPGECPGAVSRPLRRERPGLNKALCWRRCRYGCESAKWRNDDGQIMAMVPARHCVDRADYCVTGVAWHLVREHIRRLDQDAAPRWLVFQRARPVRRARVNARRGPGRQPVSGALGGQTSRVDSQGHPAGYVTFPGVQGHRQAVFPGRRPTARTGFRCRYERHAPGR